MRRRRERGAVLILFTLAAVVLVGFLGLAVDVGMLYLQKQKVQSAADAGALGAAQAMRRGQTGSITTLARAESARNGFTNDVGGVVVSVNNPPLGGQKAGNSAYTEVVVTQPLNTYFLRILGQTTATVSARAVATVGGATGCIYAMSSSAEGAVRIDGRLVTDCGIISNSNSSKSLEFAGGTLSAAYYRVVGNYIGNVSPTPTIHAAATPDPLLTMTAPPFPSTHFYSTSVSGTATLNPGIYHGGISISQYANVTFNPGVYVMNGGNLFASGKNTLNGTGVTFYFTANQTVPVSRPPGFLLSKTTTPGTVLINGGTATEGVTNFSAPTSGPAEGKLFIQDRTQPANSPFDIQGSNQTDIEGIIYFPGTDILYQNSTENQAHYTIIVGKTLRLDGGGANLRVKNDYSVLASGAPIKTQVVISE